MQTHPNSNRPNSGDSQEDGLFSLSSPSSKWPDWSGWWSDEIKRRGGFEEQSSGTDPDPLQTPSGTGESESVVEHHEERLKNMENDEVIAQRSGHQLCKCGKFVVF